ncbi:hypothetical protein RHMOL_Rhmol04G0362900 [Rhododendron molle]|uniref:Uncharacterized protein n=1 Tax=Rhododendron molle TaxID=49168 RepID=A0ACC0P985_RHOML|nr:hypothetical protein RHMOL_Rhmol04G0362900 [Rhododendron molle]
MVSLKLKKRLAASVLKCGEPCWIHPDEVDEISVANSLPQGFSALVNWPEKANRLHGKGLGNSVINSQICWPNKFEHELVDLIIRP